MLGITPTTGPAAAAAIAPESPLADPLAGMGREEFMLLLMAQLRNQNPLEPLQDKDLIGQVTQLNALEELQAIKATLQTMAGARGITDAAALIGKTIQAETDEGSISGQVTGVSLRGEQVVLWLGSRQVPLSSVIKVESGGVA